MAALTRILVLNPGSSSLKATVLEPPDRTPLVAAAVDWGADATRAAGRASTISAVLETLGSGGVSASTIDAVGYRVVHGGTRFTGPVVIDDGVLEAIDALAPLAPLHNPVATDTIRAARTALPGVPHVACSIRRSTRPCRPRPTAIPSRRPGTRRGASVASGSTDSRSRGRSREPASCSSAIP